MKKLLLAAALTAALTVQAQTNVCTGYSATGPTLLPDSTGPLDLQCVPDTVGGTGKGGFKFSWETGGITTWVWCPQSDGTWNLYFGARTAAEVATFALRAPGFYATPTADRPKYLNDLAYELGTGDLLADEYKKIWCPAWADITASYPQQWVVGPATRTKDNTRPAYPWVNGVRGTVENGRAVSGSRCNPFVGRMEGTVAYYGVNGRTDQVAVCVKK